MSLDSYIFSNKAITKNEDWQNSVDALEFKLKLLFSDDVATRHGHLPAVWADREAGFECGPTTLRDILECYSDFDLGGPWTYAYAFHWSTLTGCLGGMDGHGSLCRSDEWRRL